ncbi:MAG: hypothetical protein AAB909_03650, partial [Patescibacteria group bacterium]
SQKSVAVGVIAVRADENLSIEVGRGILGQAVDVLGKSLIGQKYATDRRMALDTLPLGIVSRKKVDKPLYTGLILTDLMVPLGKGQRELVIGDRKTGKSYFLMQAILAQVEAGSVCIYAAIGKKRAEIMRTVDFFMEKKVMDKVVVVAASSQDGAGEIFLCPYTAMAIAEYFRDLGQDVLVVLDDMSVHAKFYRQLSLISKKFPGRDSYPGDIFHIHSKLLERAGNFVVANGREASITCLPAVETVQGDITGYIPTNLMSMTDGHIYVDSELFFKGRRPAVNPFVSVTRVGYQTQSKLRRDASRSLYELLNNYEKTQSFLRFGAELGENSRQVLALGDKVLKFFDQPYYLVVPEKLQIWLLAGLMSGVWDGVGTDKWTENYLTRAKTRETIDGLVTGADNMEKIYVSLRPVWEGLI